HSPRGPRTTAPRQPRLARRLAPLPAPPPSALGHRPPLGPLPRPASARPAGGLPQPGQERHLLLPRLRHRLRHPQGLALHRGPDRRAAGRTPPGGAPAPAEAGGESGGAAAVPVAGPGFLQRRDPPLPVGGPLRLPDAAAATGSAPGPPPGAERVAR